MKSGHTGQLQAKRAVTTSRYEEVIPYDRSRHNPSTVSYQGLCAWYGCRLPARWSLHETAPNSYGWWAACTEHKDQAVATEHEAGSSWSDGLPRGVRDHEVVCPSCHLIVPRERVGDDGVCRDCA